MTMPARQQGRVRPFLEKNTFLGKLPADVLDGLINSGQVRTFARGVAIYRRGDPGDSLMLVVSGRVRLGNISRRGKEIVHFYVAAGEAVGDVAALDGLPRAAGAWASEDAEIFIMPMRDLLPQLKAHPDALYEVVRALCAKIRIAVAMIEDNTLEMRSRSARGLLRLAQRHGRRDGDGGPLRLTITQDELGKVLDMSRANVNRQLGHLKTAGVIRINGTDISIVDEPELAALAEADEAD
jgi:CRP/FNR family transcriptional regulator, cyclic AMP receptor protein